MKKKSNIILVFMLIITIIVILLCILINNGKIKLTPRNRVNKIEKTNISLKEDFYESVNADIINSHILESDESYWGLFSTQTQDEVDKRTEKIVDEIIENKEKYSEDSEEYKINKLYESAVKSEEVHDISALEPYIEKIESARDIDEFMDAIYLANSDLALDLILNMTLLEDLEDNSKIMLLIDQFPMFLKAEVYYNPLYVSYVNMVEESNIKVFKYYGYTEEQAKESASQITKMCKDIAYEAKTFDTSLKSIYNVITIEQLKDTYSNIHNIDSFINQYGSFDKVILAYDKQASFVNSYLNNENLGVLKEFAKLYILYQYGPYGDPEYNAISEELYAKLQGAEVSDDPIEKKSKDLVIEVFDTNISKKYIDKYIDKKSVDEFNIIVDEIIEQYKIKLEENEWLTESTKEKAIIKLNSIDKNIVCPEDWENYSEFYELNDSLLENMINISKVNKQKSLEDIRAHKKYWKMSTLTVNAYYDIQDNSINFPAAVLAYSKYDKNNYYSTLGSLGVVIGHEISHSFDPNGALFDEKGNMSNWWTEEDTKEFNKKQKEVVKYFKEYGTNARNTVGENIADLGGLSCAVEIAKRKNATNEELKDLFIGFANIWASKCTEEYADMMALDVHPQDKVRTNATLSAIDEFYEVFDIKPEDGMYRAPEVRPKVW